MGRYRDLKDLNNAVYNSPNQDFNGFKWVDTYESKGLLASVYKQGNEFILAIKCTDVFRRTMIIDIRNDIAIYRKHLPEQSFCLETYYNKIKDKCPISLITGYSLGGSLAQILSGRHKIEAITFCSVGTKGLCKDDSRITNFGNLLDIFYTLSLARQVGKIMIMKVGDPPQYYPNGTPSLLNHFYSNYGDPETAIAFDDSKLDRRIDHYVFDSYINNQNKGNQ